MLSASVLTLALNVSPMLRLSPSSQLLLARASSTRMSEVVEVTDEWTTTASGLKYIDISMGDGETPKEGDVVKVEYTGWLESTGSQFDSSVGRDPIAFAVGTGRVIPGWDEGVISMKVGGQRRLSIPPEIGYGEQGAGPSIPGGSQLQFECKLVAIETGFAAFVSSFPGGIANIILGSLLLLSFIPYFLPPDLVPEFWLPKN